MADRALSIRQPWADLILAGHKDVENRTWPVPRTVDLPARIGIHASKRLDYEPALKRYLRVIGKQGSALTLLSTRPQRRGALLGYVTVTSFHLARFTSAGLVCGCTGWADAVPDVHHWALTDPEPLPEPIPMPGALGLWRLDDASERGLREQQLVEDPE